MSDAKKEALERIRRYARNSAELRLKGNIQNARHWDDLIERVYSEANRRGWSEDSFVLAEEKGRQDAERLVRSRRDPAMFDFAKGTYSHERMVNPHHPSGPRVTVRHLTKFNTRTGEPQPERARKIYFVEGPDGINVMRGHPFSGTYLGSGTTIGKAFSIANSKTSRDPSKGKGKKMAGRPRRRRRRLKMMRAARTHHGLKHRRRRHRRDESMRDWKGNPKGHAKAARSGWKLSAKPGWKPKHERKRSKSKRRRRDPERDWKKEPRRHAKAAAYGWHNHARVGWVPKRMTYTGVLASTAKKHRSKKRRGRARDHY